MGKFSKMNRFTVLESQNCLGTTLIPIKLPIPSRQICLAARAIDRGYTSARSKLPPSIVESNFRYSSSAVSTRFSRLSSRKN